MDSTSQLRVEAGASVHHGQYEEAMHQEVTSLCRAGGAIATRDAVALPRALVAGATFGALGPLWGGRVAGPGA